MHFDPIRSRASDDEFFLAYVLSRETRVGEQTGNFGRHDVGAVVGFWLDGLSLGLDAVLHRSMGWVNDALGSGECFGARAAKNWWQEELWLTKALGQWMLGLGTEQASWQKAASCSDASLAQDSGVYPAKHIPTLRLDRYMGYCVLAGDFDRGLKEYERFHPAGALKLTSINSPRAFAYILCRYELLGEGDAAFVHRAGRKVLARHLQSDWLAHGQWLNAALWLHAVYSHRSAAVTDPTVPTDARGIVLRAYENMPDVTRPDFVK